LISSAFSDSENLVTKKVIFGVALYQLSKIRKNLKFSSVFFWLESASGYVSVDRPLAPDHLSDL